MRLIDADALKDRWTIASQEPVIIDALEVLESINEATTVDAVPVPELLELRDWLYENDLISMKGLCRLNAMIGKYKAGGAQG